VLSAADADLVRRDGALPGLATLLDPETFAAALRTSLRDTVQGSAKLAYVRYKPSWSCLAAYRIEAGGDALDVYAKAHARDAGIEFHSARHGIGAAHDRGTGRIGIPDRGIVVFVFPDDLRLKGLPRLLDASSRRRLLSKVVPDRSDLWEARADPLTYRPERRYSLRLRGSNGRGAAVKLYARKAFAAAERNATGLASRSVLRLAHPLGASERHRVLAVEWVEGPLLRDRVRGDGPVASAAASVGAALAEFHEQDPGRLPPRSRRGELARLRSLAVTLGFLHPPLEERVAALSERLSRRLAALPERLGPVHGDFYDKQVVLSRDRAAIIDLDQVACGHPAADLGLFRAHLELDAVLKRVDPARADAVGGALLEGYRKRARAALDGALPVYTAAALLELASYAFRRRLPAWPEKTDELLARAERALGG
jgi:aminoglycoside phosphotransferase (APT) family kinase protein